MTYRLEGGCSIQLSYQCAELYSGWHRLYWAPKVMSRICGKGKKIFYNFPMLIARKTLKDEAALRLHLQSGVPSLYLSSQTSTVIPYDHLAEALPSGTELTLVDLSKLPAQMEISEAGQLLLRGAVSWQEARRFVRSKGRDIKTAPTEELALVLAGVATSCTGERSFGFGNLRRQVKALSFMNYQGEEFLLLQNQALESLPWPGLSAVEQSLLREYQEASAPYQSFKNGPFPFFERATDLMIGTEGQLGVVTAVELETMPLENVRYLFLLLPRWEKDHRAHQEVLRKVQPFRGKILAVELVDSHGMDYLKEEERLGQGQDVLFLEILERHFEQVYAELLQDLKEVKNEHIFEISADRYHQLRAGVPRAIFERNAREGVVKEGTDVQVPLERFTDLLEYYRQGEKLGINYCLFGHFGDAHLHFNFMPKKEQKRACEDFFTGLYQKVLDWQGSPFAEHGIGLLKKKFIKDFHQEKERQFFRLLKKKMDPHMQFFPQGFMNI